MAHYYINDNQTITSTNKLSYTFKNKTISLESTSGVFCKDHIDFGTNVLLNSLPDLKLDAKVLDVGCGYGLIGLCIAKAYPKSEVDMVDVNLKALALVDANKKTNNIKNVRAFESNAYQNVKGEYDCIITNPPIRAGKSVVHEIVLNAVNYLKEEGCIYIVIQKKQGAPSLIEKMNDVYSNVNIINKEKGYFIIEGKK